MKYQWHTGCFAFVDVETTGGSSRHDRIIDIAVICVDEATVTPWSSLVDPDCEVPPSIQDLTGINNAMLRAAPSFRSIAAEVVERLNGRLFVAHNARFDYGFIRAELARCGLHYNTRPLCTVRLSRALFPGDRGFSLDALIQRFNLIVSRRHRALPDAQALVDLMEIYARLIDATQFDYHVRALLKQASLPPHLASIAIDDIPQGPGVYRFYGYNSLPLYIGKSVNLRKRILSHFSITSKQRSSQRVGMETQRIEYDVTAGELSASILELQQIHALQPLHNRKSRKAAAGYLLRLAHTVPLLELVAAHDVESLRSEQWYGPFFSPARANTLLRQLAKQHRLCLILMGLEKRQPPCFGYQLGVCDGACKDIAKGEPMRRHLEMALAPYRIPAWPFAGFLIISEQDTERSAAEAHVFYDWCHTGRAIDESDITDFLKTRTCGLFRADMFYLLRQIIGRRERREGARTLVMKVVPTSLHSSELAP